MFNAHSADLDETLRPTQGEEHLSGLVSCHGIPFQVGLPGAANVILLDQDEMRIEVAPFQATYVLFLHVVADRISNYLSGLADYARDGNELGTEVSRYTLEYADGSSSTTLVRRRFAIQQRHISWGASPFTAVPAQAPAIFQSASEEQSLGRVPPQPFGRGETRHVSGRDRSADNLWVYALSNPHPEQPIRSIVCTPGSERSLIYAISYTSLPDHPLRPGVRQKLQLRLPKGATLNLLGEVEEIGFDLGTVLSARATLVYDTGRWRSQEPDVQPVRSSHTVIVEYVAHPQAKLYVATGSDSTAVFDIANPSGDTIVAVAPATKPIRLRMVDQASSRPVAVRLHLHGAAGEYLPPRGHHRKVNPYWFEDNYGEFVNGLNQYSYVPGDCVVDLPLGEVFIQITRGYEIAPIRTSFTVTTHTEELTFELERVLPWRERGWVTADTHVHFLSPQTALLEGEAEGVNVVNLLASQWGEMFSNVGDFDGRSTFGAQEFGGGGEFMVRVGTENRMQVLGHISLLGYSGAMIHPLCTGGPSESALGDAQEVTMAEWAQRCIDQGGLVVMPHGPDPQCERAADLVLGLIHATEMMTFNPHNAQINPYGIADWYRYLNLGYHVPVVGGSDKMAASSLLGGVRTYTHLGDRPFTYEHWMAAVKAGNTFVTVGPLAELQVEGQPPGSTLHLPAGGGRLTVTWQVESVMLPIQQVEVVVGGLAVDQVDVASGLSASGTLTLPVTNSTWIALRVRGSYRDRAGDIAAHTSAVQVLVDDRPIFSPQDAGLVLEQIEGALAYVDTLAPRPAAQRYKQMRSTLEAAYNRLHQRLHRHGAYHKHTPLNDHDRSDQAPPLVR